MRFSQKTLQVLKNFSTINESIVFYSGSVLQTLSPSGTIVARAMIDSEIPETFGVFKLGEFLNAISMMDDPVLHCTKSAVVMKSDKQKFTYVCTDPSMIKTTKPGKVDLPSRDVVFEMNNDSYTRIIKALGIMRAPDVLICGDGSQVTMEVTNTQLGDSSSTYQLTLGETDHNFKMTLAAENLKIMQGDYKVTVCRRGIIEFAAPGIEYWVRCNQNSSFS